jgi:glycosyltransferase involved in cell wall biosynthesis
VISVLILTFNEEANLPRCLEALRWADDIVVFDSFSTDRTVEIAAGAGARVVQRRWDNERGQREASLRVPFKHPWVFNPDADEVATDALVREMQAAVADAGSPYVAYRVRFKTMFRDTWIKRSSLYPTWVVRLFRPERLRFDRSTNLTYLVDGPVGRLNEHFIHYTFNKGMAAWIDKHNRYSSAEAVETVRARARPMPWRGLVDRDRVRRRAALKDLSARIPCRPLFRFLYGYLWRGGVFDGRAGLTYSALMAWYEYMIVLKARQLRRGKPDLS